MSLPRPIVFLFLYVCVPYLSWAQYADFSDAAIFLPRGSDLALQQAAGVLQTVTAEHSAIQWPIVQDTVTENKPLVIMGTDEQVPAWPESFRLALSRLSPAGKDGYRIVFLPEEKTVIIAGHDDRGTLYGAGYLLRKMELRKGQVLVPEELRVSSTPAYPIRGHQLGYRPKTNAYDAWSVDQFDRYIRDLAIFGANSIEIMPPRTDDDFSNGHMQLPAIKMIAEQSRICQKYGLDVWMWYPNMGGDYVTPDSIRQELAERAAVFGALPKLDALFVPGGDPGDLQPEVLFRWLGKVAAVLHQYHPNAKIWVSPQVFRPTEQWYDAFYKEVNRGYSWLGGVVYGPWVKETIAEVRQRVREDLPIRRYPDITHSLSCQYPVPEWDLSYAVTLGRECYNPRPYGEKHIHNLFAKYAQGSISYSEGINDDVNKFVWSGQDWNPATPVMETLRDYARLFVGPDYAETMAEGIVALENNFKGPLLTNEGVQQTLLQWEDMEKTAPPQVLSNFRFQMCLLRACYDAYIRRRLINETALEQEARDALATADKAGSLKAVRQAEELLMRAADHPVQPDLRRRCFALSDSVYRSIGSQLTVRQPQAAMEGRGNFMDNIDLPLNDSKWLLSRLMKIKEMPDEHARLAEIHAMLHRTDPGPGGFYDHLGTPGSWERVVRQKTWAEDPGGLESPIVDFGASLHGDEWVDILPVGFGGQAIPRAWMAQATTLYDTPLKMRYDHLDPHSAYLIRIAYTGRFNSKIKLVADGKYLIHDYIRTGEQAVYEFPLPAAAVGDGNVELTWNCLPGERGAQVAAVWLIRK